MKVTAQIPDDQTSSHFSFLETIGSLAFRKDLSIFDKDFRFLVDIFIVYDFIALLKYKTKKGGREVFGPGSLSDGVWRQTGRCLLFVVPC